MFSLNQRFQTVINAAITYAIFIIFLIITLFHFQLYVENNITETVKVNNLNIIKPILNLRTSRMFGGSGKFPKENLRIKFDLNTDLSPLFTWNTKQVFVYLTGAYNSTSTSSSEVTFWDKIITDKKNADLDLHAVMGKYSVWDKQNGFSNKDLQLKLHWNIQPFVGNLIFGEAVMSNSGDILHIPAKEQITNGTA
ncbi:signal peptidase complex subunit SPC3 SCDLUD_000843 [Saccharomycodes ludwigii]|uniref:signal peptidase complex subunit SPC3 n=1 Tax=Saccharomycodes ludwigii TaxID=36035 RepID=UPI001E83E0E4|nr:hypothetical protein SCDLUD_000843 [Saccharomycodes ludwigii]KAH3903224.1 hypothetical protein SCDLUD_000843 [Saccharomycodes ludwigii]